ncbi:DNA-binding transcriptional regulator, MarR family [Pseudonocardia ammonioxydans]|uniref:DNA-binding transcriptional regulator, MarR family n=2 Tax=Pseudonocardia ammonioxydans TaxID=260086 RepID=A0A1I4WFP1_PSUAM|nr:DNA-binding transcriptional regulator, MarR family [Pseudonocardia ammonioxydans]
MPSHPAARSPSRRPVPAPPVPPPAPSPGPDPLLSPPRLVPGPPAGADPPETTAGLLVRAGAAVQAARRRRAARHGLPLTAVAVLDALARTDGLVQRELAARVRIGPATLTPVLDTLEGAGLAARVTDDGDRRVRRVRITDAGRDRLHAARPAAHGPRLPEPATGHVEPIREYLIAVIAALEQDHRDGPW